MKRFGLIWVLTCMSILTTMGQSINNDNETIFVKEHLKTFGQWFCFGTRSELEEQRIISGNTVITEPINWNYLMEIDKENDTEFKLYSSNAKILTPHPDKSYKLVLDERRCYKLVIIDSDSFWSESSILVVLIN